MGFSLDFKDVYTGENGIQDGRYEVVVNQVNEKSTPSGAEYVELDLIIRNDLEQKSKNAHIFHKIWKAKDTGKYNMKTFNTIGSSLQTQEGKIYNSMNDLLDDFVMKTCAVEVKNETNEYNGKSYTNVNVKRWNVTESKGVFAHKFKDAKSTNDSKFTANTNQIDISDDDLPF